MGTTFIFNILNLVPFLALLNFTKTGSTNIIQNIAYLSVKIAKFHSPNSSPSLHTNCVSFGPFSHRISLKSDPHANFERSGPDQNSIIRKCHFVVYSTYLKLKVLSSRYQTASYFFL